MPPRICGSGPVYGPAWMAARMYMIRRDCVPPGLCSTAEASGWAVWAVLLRGAGRIADRGSASARPRFQGSADLGGARRSSARREQARDSLDPLNHLRGETCRRSYSCLALGTFPKAHGTTSISLMRVSPIESACQGRMQERARYDRLVWEALEARNVSRPTAPNTTTSPNASTCHAGGTATFKGYTRRAADVVGRAALTHC
jgi:hypothetical protein